MTRRANEAAGTDFALLIRGGRVIDGSGDDAFDADVGVRDGRIAAVGDLMGVRATRVLSAEGLYVVPGFIDIHSHAERGLSIPELAPSVHNLTQGVTSVVGGADGYGAWPLHETVRDQTRRLTSQGIGTNAALMAGVGQVRRQVMGLDGRSPTAGEMARMRGLVRDAMEGGAQGLSSGLAFVPDGYFAAEAVAELAGEVVPFGGIYHTHMRSESDGLVAAVEETVRIAELSGAVTVITHFKAVGPRNWGGVRPATEVIEEARARGVRIYADQFPFTENDVPLIPPDAWWPAANSRDERRARLQRIVDALPEGRMLDLYAELASLPALDAVHRDYLTTRVGPLREMVGGALDALLPAEGRALVALASWSGVHRGPGNPAERARFLARLAEPEEGVRIRSQVGAHLEGLGGAGNGRIVQAPRPAFAGKTLAEAARCLGETPVEAAIGLALEGVRVVATVLSEDDVEHVMAKDYVATGSDGDFPYRYVDIGPMGVAQTIRSHATFPRKIRRYALERGTVTLAHAVRSSTSLPAGILGWSNRGLLREGFRADVAVLDPETIQPRATLEDPYAYSQGVEYVLVNGRLALDGGKPTGELAGRVLGPRPR